MLQTLTVICVICNTSVAESADSGSLHKRLMEKPRLPLHGHLIDPLVSTKAGLKSNPRGISYIGALKIIKDGLKPFAGDEFKLGTHSFNSSAATTVVHKDVDHHAIDNHAGWRSKNFKFRYAEDSQSRKLVVSSAFFSKYATTPSFIVFVAADHGTSTPLLCCQSGVCNTEWC